MATLLIHTYSHAPRQGILINPSPAHSPAYHPASLPALVPSNSSLSSSASSSAPGDASDYFSSKSSSPSPGPSRASPAANTHLHPNSKPRNGSNHSTVRHIRFAPLPEPRREDGEDTIYPPVFDDDDALHPSEQPMSVSVAAACPLPPSVPSSPLAQRKMLPNEPLLLDQSYSQSSSDSSEPPTDSTVPSDFGQDWENVRPSSPSLPALNLNLNAPEVPRKVGKWSKVFKPLLRSGSSKSPLARTFSRDEAAAINGELQRGRSAAQYMGAGSRNSSVSREPSLSRERRDSDFGAPLHRWTSEGGPSVGLPVSKKKRHLLFGGGSSSGGGVPLGRTQSLTSLSGKDDKKAAKGQPPVVTNGGRKQQRMLNGRVYGAKRNPNANPFANVRTDEPEFVEWGYGGMGSVKNSAGQSSMWSRVQAGDDAAGLAKKTAPEDDDGSGTAWVKRRREQREREKREREEREKAEAEAKAREAQAEVEGGTEVKAVEGEPAEENKAGSGEVEPRKSEDESVETAESEETKETVHAPSQVQTGLPTTIITTPSAPSTPMAPDTPKLEHITQAITIPAHRPHHHHHHSHSYSQSHSHHYGHHHTFSVPHVERRESGETARAIPVSSPVDAPDVPKETQELVQTPTTMSETDGERESLESSALSTTSDEEDGEESPKDADGGFGQDEEEEEMEEEVERSRLTALGAGVEKFAKHHKEEHSAGTPSAETSS